MKRINTPVKAIVLSFLLVLTCSLHAQNLKKSIKKGKAKSVETEIKMISGELLIESNTSQLMDGSFRFKKDQWKPEISYKEENGIGKLKLIAKDNRVNKTYNDDDASVWNISLNKEIQQSIDLRIGAGHAIVKLPNSNLKNFECNMAAGNMEVDLRNTSLSDFEFNAIAGEATIDLSGKWKNDLHAEIHGGVGDLVIYVPDNVGVKLEIHGIIGNVNAENFKKQDRFFMNDSYEKTKETLFIYIFGGIGEVTVKMK